MSYPRCKTCKYWQPRQFRSDGDCGNEHFEMSDGYEAPIDGLGYWDAEQYEAHFTTGPDFGCVHHEGADAIWYTRDVAVIEPAWFWAQTPTGEWRATAVNPSWARPSVWTRWTPMLHPYPPPNPPIGAPS